MENPIASILKTETNVFNRRLQEWLQIDNSEYYSWLTMSFWF